MIRTSVAVATAAILVSLLLHAFGLSISFNPLPETSGENVTADSVELGNAFEDLAEEPSEPVVPEPTQPPEPDVETPPEPETADIPTSEALVASPNPQQTFAPDTGTVPPVKPETTGPADPTDDPSGIPEPVAPTVGDTAQSADPALTPPSGPEEAMEIPQGSPEGGTEPPVPVTEPPEAPQQVVAATVPTAPAPAVETALAPSVDPVVPQATAPLETEKPIAAAQPEPATAEPVESEVVSELAVASSIRPRLPDRRPETNPLGQPDGAQETSSLQFPPSQSIESPLTVYQRDGVDLFNGQSEGGQSGGRGFSDARGPGNSDVTNYVGRVLVHLNRAPLVRVPDRGFARVFFQINPDGSLAWVDVVDSSGSNKVNQAAKAQVRAAAPFPKPPNGRPRNLAFVYRIE